MCVCTTIGFDQPKKGHNQPNGIQLLTKSEDLTIIFHQPYWGSTEHGISLPQKMATSRWDSKAGIDFHNFQRNPNVNPGHPSREWQWTALTFQKTFKLPIHHTGNTALQGGGGSFKIGNL